MLVSAGSAGCRPRAAPAERDGRAALCLVRAAAPGPAEFSVSIPERRYDLAGLILTQAVAMAITSDTPAAEALEEAAAARGSARRCYPGISAEPWATAQGAHSGTSTSPSRPTGSLRVITARWSHTPRSLGWETVHAHSQARCGQPAMVRQVSPTARTAGSLVSL